MTRLGKIHGTIHGEGNPSLTAILAL